MKLQERNTAASLDLPVKQGRINDRIAMLGIPDAEMTDSVKLAVSALLEKLDDNIHDTTKKYRVANHVGTFAVISTMSQPFCSGCNRLRLSADGDLCQAGGIANKNRACDEADPCRRQITSRVEVNLASCGSSNHGANGARCGLIGRNGEKLE